MNLFEKNASAILVLSRMRPLVKDRADCIAILKHVQTTCELAHSWLHNYIDFNGSDPAADPVYASLNDFLSKLNHRIGVMEAANAKTILNGLKEAREVYENRLTTGLVESEAFAGLIEDLTCDSLPGIAGITEITAEDFITSEGERHVS